MPITSIQRDTNNNVSLVRMISTDSLATIDGTDYIAQQQENINTLNGGTWQWFITDMILCAAEDGNAFFEFIDDSFTSLVIFGSIGSGIINPGMTNQLPYYSTNGRVLSPLTNMANAILATNGSQVPGLTQTLPTAVQLNITSLGTIATGVWNGTGIAVPFGGTGASSFTAYSVLCAGTTSTGAFQNVSGVGTAGQILTSNGAGLLPTWQNSPGSGTVSPGLQNQVAYYAANGTTVSGLTSIASGVLITSGLGVPSISQTLPSAVQTNITALGTIATGVWNGTAVGAGFGGTGLSSITAHNLIIGNGTGAATLLAPSATSGIPLVSQGAASDPAYSTAVVAGGGTGLTSLTAYALLAGGTTSTGNVQQVSGVGTANQVLVSQGAGALPQWANVPGLTPAALTKTDDTNVTLTLGGTPATALLQATSLTLGWTGQLGLTRGGTNASLTASNGGIVYSGSSALAILAGTATAGLALLSGASGAPSWSTAPPVTKVIVQKFTSTGTYTPTTGMVYCIAEGVGGGGGGGGITGGGAGTGQTSGGGGGGEYSKITLTAAQIGASKAVAIGAAGAAGSAGNNNGGAGGNTTLGSTLLVANGGAGGIGGNLGVGGAGGSGGTGDVTIPGGAGWPGMSSSSTSITNYAGAGGQSHWSGMTPPGQSNASSAGTDGAQWGGGGTGANGYNSSSNFAGGAGKIGYMIITEFVSV